MRKVAVLAVLLFAVGAWANELTFNTATTQGCFGIGCSPTSSTASISDLTFQGLAFGPASTTGGNLTISLGKFTLTDSTSALFLGPLTNSTFTADVEFTMPSNIGSSFKSFIIGGVVQNIGGDVLLVFGGPRLFAFDGGSFEFQVDDLNLTALGRNGSDTEMLVGEVTHASAVPEPASLSLLGCGLIAFAFKLRSKIR